MKDFATAKNGYNKDEVALFISQLEDELSEKQQKINSLQQELEGFRACEKEIKEKERNVSLALTAAVEKAKQIEKSSNNVLNLKIQELNVLYARWERVLNELIEKYPNLDEINNVKKLMQDFKNSIKSSIKEDFRFNNSQTQTSTDPMRILLQRIQGNMDRQLEGNKPPMVKPRIRKQLPQDMQTKQSELNKLEEKSTMIKPIYNSRIEAGEKYESLVDKFLTEDATPDSAYANKITSKVSVMPDVSESGFDLKEAVNPKQDLDEIMKSFDFFGAN